MNRIKLRALTKSDTPKTLAWHNQEDISLQYLGHPFPVNIENEINWYEKILLSNLPVTVFGIELIEPSLLIGISVLRDINLINRTAEFAIYIGDTNYRGLGISKEGTFLTLQFGFHRLGLNRISVRILQTNIKSIRLHESLGFVKEGTFRMSVFKNNEYLNECCYSLLQSEFNALLK